MIVLLGQDRRGHQDRHLLSVHHGPEGGAQGHLGFAEAHIPANQAVHGLLAAHVLLHVRDGLNLIRRLLVFEGGFKFPVEIVGGRKTWPFRTVRSA